MMSFNNGVSPRQNRWCALLHNISFTTRNRRRRGICYTRPSRMCFKRQSIFLNGVPITRSTTRILAVPVTDSYHSFRRCVSHHSSSPRGRGGRHEDDEFGLDDFEESHDTDAAHKTRLLIRNRGDVPASVPSSPLTDLQAAAWELHQKRLESQHEMRRREAARKEKEGRQRAAVARHQKYLKAIEECRNMVQTMQKVETELWSQFFDLKYSEIHRGIHKVSKFNRLYKSKYNTIRGTFRSLAVKAVCDQADILSKRYEHLVAGCETFIGPRDSARKRIHQIFKDEHDRLSEYVRLQDLARLHRHLAEEIDRDIHCSGAVYGTAEFRKWSQANYRTASAMTETLHEFRYYYRLRYQSEAPFGKSSYLRLLAWHGQQNHKTRQASDAWSKSVRALLAQSPHPSCRNWDSADMMGAFLKPRLDKSLGARDPRMDIFWRQLDIFSLLDLYALRLQTLVCDLKLLRMTFHVRSAWWPKLNAAARKVYFWRLEQPIVAFEEWYSAFQSEITAYQFANWLRLLSETKLSGMGLIPSTVERGLFTVPNPLSQDPQRFNHWLDEFKRVRKSALASQERLSIFQKKTYLPTHHRRRAASRAIASKWAEEHQREALSDSKQVFVRTQKIGSPSSPLSRSKSRAGQKAAKVSSIARVKLSEKFPSKPGPTDRAEAPLKGRTSIRSGQRLNMPTPFRSSPSRKYSTSVTIAKKTESDLEAVTETSRFWTYNLHKAPGVENILVHYCRSLESSERIASLFLESEVVGFDIEWKPHMFASKSIPHNISLIQLANQERIALFHTAVFRPGRVIEDFVPPSLKRVLERSDLLKVGVSIKADCTRLRKHLGIEAQGLFELSHLYKLVKYAQTYPKLINKRTVNLSMQVEEHMGLPLYKHDDVRLSDWTRSLNYQQVQYAANDPYACLCLFHVMEAKRKSLVPIPPRPASAELNLPILLADGEATYSKDDPQDLEAEIIDESPLI